VIAVDGRGRPSFELLQGRMGLTAESDIRRRMKEIPIGYVIFDLLYLDGRLLLDLPYRERRRMLEEEKLKGRFWQTPPASIGEGQTTLKASETLGLEGVMAKRLDSTYRPGARSDAWLKIKNHQGQELVIAGWLPGEGGRSGRVGALLVGYYESGKLIYALHRQDAGPADVASEAHPARLLALRGRGEAAAGCDLHRPGAGRRVRVRRVDQVRPAEAAVLQGAAGGQGPEVGGPGETS